MTRHSINKVLIKATAPPNAARLRGAEKISSAAPPDAAPRALKNINFTVYHSRGYTASRAALRRTVSRREMKAGKSFTAPRFF